MERPRLVRPDGIQFDPSFAKIFLKEAAALDRKFDVAASAGLMGADQEMLRMYIAQRQVRDELPQAGDLSFFNQRGIVHPLIFYQHRRLGVDNPYQAAMSSLDLAIGIYIDRNYPDDMKQKPFLIRSSVNNLVSRMTVQHVLRGFGSVIEFDRWEPSRKEVTQWGEDWRDRFARVGRGS